MRLRRPALMGLTSMGMLLGGLVLSSPSAVAEPLAAKSVGTQLPVQGFSAIELDEGRGRLYLAQGASTALPLVVTDLDGVLQTEVSAVTGATDVVLSDDHQTVLVAQGDRVTTLDANTLVPSATYGAPAGACVSQVEPAADKIVGSFRNCGIGFSGLLIWSAPDSPPVVYASGIFDNLLVDASPGGGARIIAGDDGQAAKLSVIDVSGPTPVVVSSRNDVGDSPSDYALSPDGTEVVESVGYPYEHRAYTVPDLSDAGNYPSGRFATDAAWSGDGSTIAIGRSSTASNESDVVLYDKDGSTPKYAVDFRDNDDLREGGLVVNATGTRVWAVTSDDPYQRTQLLHSFGPSHPPKAPTTDIQIAVQTGSGKEKSTGYVTVTWTSPVSKALTSTGYQSFSLYAGTDGAAETYIGGAEMTAVGTYTVTYALPRGTTTFTARYTDSENWYPAATVTATLTR
ncbi:hypothetical protein [Kribbella sp. NPDC000426]|uniref:hypothetical protein n=1 Tax=Kribbella sp. NPDC000426 TaxID=3154255 RepID=UPI003333DC21